MKLAYGFLDRVECALCRWKSTPDASSEEREKETLLHLREAHGRLPILIARIEKKSGYREMENGKLVDHPPIVDYEGPNHGTWQPLRRFGQ